MLNFSGISVPAQHVMKKKEKRKRREVLILKGKYVECYGNWQLVRIIF